MNKPNMVGLMISFFSFLFSFSRSHRVVFFMSNRDQIELNAESMRKQHDLATVAALSGSFAFRFFGEFVWVQSWEVGKWKSTD